MRVLYVFAGSRRELPASVPRAAVLDSDLYGLNYMAEHGITAEGTDAAARFPKAVARLLGFRLRNFLLFFATRGYDIVFGSPLLYILLWKKLIPTHRRFIILNMSLVRLLKSHAHHPLRHAFLCWLLAVADGVVNLTRVQQEYLAEAVPALRNRMRVVRLGVAAAAYTPDRVRKDFLLAVGRDNGRDYATLLAAAQMLPERSFVIVCSERNIRGIAAIPTNVTVHFDMPHMAMQRLLEEAQALLLITHDDSNPDGADCSGQTVLLEALAAGTPVIATARAYLTTGEYVTEGKEVLLVPPHDVDAIVAQVRALDNGEFRASLARAARARAETLSMPRMGTELADFFRVTMHTAPETV